MKQANSFSLVQRYDGSYFYIIELGRFQGLYKYMLADWKGSQLRNPMIVYSHTKRSNLSRLDKNYFDNNLLDRKRLDKYLNKKNNLYIGGIDRLQNMPTREYKEGIVIPKNYKEYIRNNNYILIELISKNDLYSFNIYEFVNNKHSIDFESSLIYTEKDLLNMNDETDYVINKLLDKKRVEKKLNESKGYVGSVINVNGTYKRTSSESSIEKVKRAA